MGSQQKFAVFDIDGTLFRSGLYREVFFELIRMKALPKGVYQMLADKETAWQKRTHGRAFGEFEQSMVEMFDKQLPKLKVAYFDLAAERVIEKHLDNVYAYTRDLVKVLKDQGYFMIAISGSQTELVGPFAQHYGFDHWVGADYERKDGYFTGEAVRTHKGKDLFLNKIIKKHDLTLKGSYAVGDTGGDIGMLAMVENPVVFNPDKELYTHARSVGWKIVLERKNSVYELTSENGSYTLN
jgi:HAD superfamily hydrolase (TIGR01490 family)